MYADRNVKKILRLYFPFENKLRYHFRKKDVIFSKTNNSVTLLKWTNTKSTRCTLRLPKATKGGPKYN